MNSFPRSCIVVLELAREASLLGDSLRHQNIAPIFSVTILKYVSGGGILMAARIFLDPFVFV